MSNPIEKLVGQLIIAGFRDKSINDRSLIVNYIKNFNLAGVILYDIELEIGGKDLNQFMAFIKIHLGLMWVI